MDLRRFRYFIAVAEERHFGRAAARLHIAQPPLSQQIRALEKELGVELFHRTTRRVELTEAGAAYLVRARDILATVDDAAHEARQVAAGSLGRLAVGCVGSATYSLLPRLARRLSDELPRVEFTFRGEMLVPDQVEALRAGTIDVALLRPPIADPSIAVDVLRREDMVVAIPTEHHLASKQGIEIGDLREESLIVHSSRRDSVMFDTVASLCRQAGFEPKFRHEVHETSTLVTLVAGGLGVAIVPEPVRALALHGVTYRTLRAPGATTELGVAHLVARSEPILRRATEVIRQIVADL